MKKQKFPKNYVGRVIKIQLYLTILATQAAHKSLSYRSLGVYFHKHGTKASKEARQFIAGIEGWIEALQALIGFAPSPPEHDPMLEAQKKVDTLG
jgi:hypothetical protein